MLDVRNLTTTLPHGICLVWDSALLWVHVLADALIASAYFTIPLALLYFVRNRHDLPFNWVFLWFGAFILACGTSHVMEIWTIWRPDYWAEGAIKVVTAVLSVATAVAVWPLMPKALKLPSPQQLKVANADLRQMNEALSREIAERQRAESSLRASEERYRLAASATHDAIWDRDILENRIRWGEAVFTTFQWNEALRDTTLDWWRDRLHPDDCDTVMDSMDVMSQDRSRQDWEQEYRFRRADGSCAAVLDRGLLQWNAELERRVSRRTEELVGSQQRLRALAAELSLAEQRERRRLASELHDHLSQLLALGRMKVGQMKSQPRESWSLTRLSETEELLDEALTYIRTLVAELHPPVLHEGGLPVALEWLAEHMWRHDLRVDVHLDQTCPPLPEYQAILAFQCIRELLFNVLKHARTGRATIRLERVAEEMHLSVEDQGVGCEPTRLEAEDRESSKFGLFSIRERMETMGGRFHIRSTVGQGTTATIVIPMGPPGQPPAGHGSNR